MRAARRLWDTLSPIDRWTLIYLGVVSIALALSFRSGAPEHWWWLLVAHLELAVLVCLAPEARRGGPIAQFLADWYPILLLPGLYGEIGILTIHAGFQNDVVIQRLEEWIFGSQVSYRWIREMPNPWLSWSLHACYLAYYAILWASPFVLWITNRRDAARNTILAVMLTFYFCYVVFLFFPVAGPRYAFALTDNIATQVAPARWAQWLLNRGDSWGAAFPSSHVAASVVATGMALRYWRPLGLALVPFTAGLVAGVVYGQFHYGVDALTGLVLAALALALTARWLPVEAPSAVTESVVSVLDAPG
ncbi:MAG TPA: phosphatase PAP2 family protein [Gemmatimonadales bacterium]|nr:phosphatase PAP2 family protein [Gemmatimonadales bacterium]